MSHISVHEGAQKAMSPPTSAHLAPNEKVDLTPEAKDALIARARDVLEGRVCPSAMAATPDIENFLKREYGRCDPPPTAEAIACIVERLRIVDFYQGQPIATHRTVDDVLAVLAVGEAEILALLTGLTHDEKCEVVVMDTLGLIFPVMF